MTGTDKKDLRIGCVEIKNTKYDWKKSLRTLQNPLRTLRETFFLFFFIPGTVYSQIETMKINKETFFSPSIASMNYLMINVDSVKWNESLLPLGFKSLPTPQKINALEYRKSQNGITQYIGFDDQYWVLTVIWKDESGKNMISNDLKKSLKGKDQKSPGIYKIEYGGQNLIIGIESDKDKVINEMITVEIERK